MNPIYKYAIGTAVVIGALYAAYHHGCSVTSAQAQIKADAIELQHKAEIISWQGKVRAAEQQAAQDMAAIDAQHQKDIANEKHNAATVLAAYRTGVIGLRDDFKTVTITTTVLPSTATSTGGSDGTRTVGLRDEHVSFLVQEASRADQVADQLRACQAVVKADRVVRP